MFRARIDRSFPWKAVETFLAQRDWGIGCDDLKIQRARVGGLFSTGMAYRVACSFYRAGQLVETRPLLVKRSPYVRFEDQSLKLLESRLSDCELRASVPHSIGLLPEESVIITDFFPATSSFHRDVLRATMPHFKRRDVTVLERQAAAIGAWLAAFQSAVSENAKELLALELEEARHRLAELPLLSPSEKKRTMEIVASLSSELGPMPVLLSHGDFAPRNILFRGEKVIVIDWEMVPDRPRPFLFDAHYFAACLSKRHTDLLVTRYIIDRCMTAFLEGYSKACPYPEFLQPAWRATRLVALVTVMSRQFRASRRSPVSSWLTRKRPFLVHLATEIRKEL